MAVNDLTNLQALDYVRDRLKRLGVDKALARAGARQGDTVRIGKMTLEYTDDECGPADLGRAAPGVIVVAKIGTSSITDDHGEIDVAAIEKLCSEVADLRSQGHRVVVVTSGAIAAGLPALGLSRRAARTTSPPSRPSRPSARAG